MSSLYYSFDTRVEHAYIITMLNHSHSVEYSKRCQQSCQDVGMPYVVWEAFDGSDNEKIVIPDRYKNDSFFKLLKLQNSIMSASQVACILSHISLWLECALLDKPIVILEHDAIMLRKFENMESYNALVYLGCAEWVKGGWNIHHIPPHGSETGNYRFMLRAHAYAIDPPMAKNLLSYVLKYGIISTADHILRADIFNITHQGVYAYDEREVTTINNPDLVK